MFVLFYTMLQLLRHTVRMDVQGDSMKRSIVLALLVAFMTVLVLETRPDAAASMLAAEGNARFTGDGKLLRPEGYRKWVFLSSGYGMSYSESASNPDHQMFTNVFVPPADYDYFLLHGIWPEKTMFVLEMYGSQSKGSINQHGHFQTEFMGLDVEVKDASRFPDKWAYFGFDATEASAAATSPSKNDCWKCHEQNAAVEHTFVQFYPVLLQVAKDKKTVKEGVKLP